MSQAIAVPLTITPEASDFVRELGMHEQLEQMLDHARQIIPSLYEITVSLLPRYDEPGELDAVIIDAFSDDPAVRTHPFGSDWGRWKMETFPPAVFQHFTLIDIYVPTHAR
jgi:hypothetical protein